MKYIIACCLMRMRDEYGEYKRHIVISYTSQCGVIN